MGGTESTGRLNGTETEEEERRRRRESGGDTNGAGGDSNGAGGGSHGAGGGSNGAGGGYGAAAIGIGIAGAAVVWGISKMLSDTEEKDEARMIRTHDQGANRSRHVNQTQTKYFGSGSTPLLDLYKPTPKDIMLTKKKVWFPPPSNRVKMNTDGAFHPAKQGQPSAYAGILRNHGCKCIRVFRGYRTGPTDIFEVEIFGILKGLELLAELGHKGAILENDNDQAVFWTKGEKKTHDIPKESMNDNCKEMIDKCRTLARENKIDIRNIDREANKCADELGRLALKERNQYVQNDLPDSVKRLVDKDKAAYHRNLSLK